MLGSISQGSTDSTGSTAWAVLKMLRGWKICEKHLKESEPSQAVGDRFKRLNTFWRCKNGPFEPFFEPCLKIMTFKQILKPLVETSSCWNHPWCELMKHPFKWLNLIQTLPQSTSCPKKTLPFWSSIGLASLLEVAEDGFESSPAKVLSSILSEPYWKTRYPQTNIIN